MREILHRELYRGVVVWNRTRKRDVWGLKRYLARPEDQWMRREAPELRIVDDALWTAAHRRLEESRASYLWSTNGKLNGRAPAVKAIDSKYLLTGFAVRDLRRQPHGTLPRLRVTTEVQLPLRVSPPARADRLRQRARSADGQH